MVILPNSGKDDVIDQNGAGQLDKSNLGEQGIQGVKGLHRLRQWNTEWGIYRMAIIPDLYRRIIL